MNENQTAVDAPDKSPGLPSSQPVSRRVAALTLDQIDALWGLYVSAKVLKVLEQGEWKYRKIEEGMRHIAGTKAEVVKLKDVISFPEYVRQKVKKAGNGT